MSHAFLALVPAAGAGVRFSEGEPKQFVAIHGRPAVAWTVERLLSCGAEEVVVALPAGSAADADPELAGAGRLRVVDGDGLLGSDERVRFVEGGSSRQDSVQRCLAEASGDGSDLVLVHDGVRPAVDETDVRATVVAAAQSGAAVLGRAVHDTVKEVGDGRILGTIDRRTLFRAETPQVFRREVLERAFEEAERDGFVGTDESSLVERLEGVVIRAVEASAPNPKLTRPRDLPWVEALLTGRGTASE